MQYPLILVRLVAAVFVVLIYFLRLCLSIYIYIYIYICMYMCVCVCVCVDHSSLKEIQLPMRKYAKNAVYQIKFILCIFGLVTGSSK